jgi:hypothetical protein
MRICALPWILLKVAAMCMDLLLLLLRRRRRL